MLSLIADVGGSADNINALFDDSAPGPPDSTTHTPPPPYYTDNPWLPAEPLAAFRGVPSMGDWTLDVCDDAGGDTGTLEQWTLFMETDVVILDPAAQGVLALLAPTAAALAGFLVTLLIDRPVVEARRPTQARA